MKFSIKVQYGLQAMLELAFRHASGPVQISDISKNQRIPIRYLEQLMLVLKRAKLVTSIRGKKGGYTLSRKPVDITLLEAVEALEGPIELVSKKAKRDPVLYDLFANLQNDMKENLEGATLKSIVDEKEQRGKAYFYEI